MRFLTWLFDEAGLFQASVIVYGLLAIFGVIGYAIYEWLMKKPEPSQWTPEELQTLFPTEKR